jgi:phosphotriesterase-related protein
MAQLITTLGPREKQELGVILPHEHVFVDLRTWDQTGYAEADPADVIRLMRPEIEEAREAGITAIVECSTRGVGRRADIDKAVSEATDFPLVVPTGFYREPWIPDWVHSASEDELAELMTAELVEGIEGTGVRAGWIKLSAGDDGLTATETKVLRAAARAGATTGAVIGSHTVRGWVVREELAIIEAAGYRPDRFIWIHTQAEPDWDIHLEIARRGAWIEYDNIGGDDPAMDDAFYLDLIQRVLDAGLSQRLLVSHDRGWYDPGLPGGGTPKSYTYISLQFIPKLSAAGVDEAALQQITRDNPFRAFARPG